jgi:hypothetical protein
VKLRCRPYRRLECGLEQLVESIVTYFETALVEIAAGLPSAFAVRDGLLGMMHRENKAH